MRAATQQLMALLMGNEVQRCDLYTLRLKTGQEYRYTNADVAIVVRGNTYQHDGPDISGSRMRLVRGLEVDRQRLTVTIKPEHQIAGVPWLTAVRSGALDGAEVVIEKAFMRAWTDTPQTLEWFRGEVAEVRNTDQQVTLTVESDAAKFDRPLPGTLFKATCTRDLFDGGCGLSRGNYQAAGAVAGGSTLAQLYTTLGQPSGYFALGYLVFTSGPNVGVSRSVRAHVQQGGILELSAPLVFAPTVGDSFVIYPGCDKAKTTCETKFNNVIHFRAMPFVPKPETVV